MCEDLVALGEPHVALGRVGLGREAQALAVAGLEHDLVGAKTGERPDELRQEVPAFAGVFGHPQEPDRSSISGVQQCQRVAERTDRSFRHDVHNEDDFVRARFGECAEPVGDPPGAARERGRVLFEGPLPGATSTSTYTQTERWMSAGSRATPRASVETRSFS